MFILPVKGTNQDLNDALKWYKKAVAQGRAGAQYNLGL
jgi:Sel1 repeat.